MPRIRFRSPLEDVSAEVPAGSTLLDAAEMAHAQVGHSCGGACACSTCHVWVRAGAPTLSEAADDELDRLDQAFDVRAASRLACQARVGTAEVDIWITQESLRAFMDEHPDIRHELERTGRWPPPSGPE